MMFPPHEWGPDPHTPDTTTCLWCHRPFAKAGGTSCPLNEHAREAAVEATTRLLVADLPVEPQRRHATESTIDVVLIAVAVLVCLIVAASIIGLASAHDERPSRHEMPSRTAVPTRYVWV